MSNIRTVLVVGATGSIGRDVVAATTTAGRKQLAETIVQSLLSRSAVNKTFELFATAGEAPASWDGLFARLDADTDLNGAHDRDTLPLAREPQHLRTDIDRLTRP
jgi:dihydrodipicolinate reductase